MKRLAFVVESGTDVRLVNGLAERFTLEVLVRPVPGGREINWPPSRPVDIVAGPRGRLAFASWAGRRLARHAAPPLVLVQGYGAAALAANLAGRLAHRSVTMLVCSPVERYYEARRAAADPAKPFRARELRALRWLARLNARAGQRYVVLSRHLADEIRGHGTTRPIHLVPVYGVDTTVFTPAAESRGAVRARLGLPPGGFIVLFSSRIAPEKDADTLLDAAAALTRDGTDLTLLHLSGGHEAFRAAAGRRGLTGHIVTADAAHPERALPDYYRAADVCVQASREEGLGFSPLEALACGTPVIASAVGGLRETIVDGQTGWSYPVGDVGALTAALRQVRADPAEAARRAAAGRALVEQRFERRRVFADLDAILQASV